MENKKDCNTIYYWIISQEWKSYPSNTEHDLALHMKKRNPVCNYLNVLKCSYKIQLRYVTKIICSSHERDGNITKLCYISFLTFNLIVNCVHTSLFYFAALKRTTRGFDAKGNCSARTYEYLTPTFAFAKDYVRHTCCLWKSYFYDNQ